MGILEIVFNSRKFDLNDDVLMGFDNYFDKKSKDYNSFCLDEEDINPLQNFVAQIKSADSDSVIYVSTYGYEITNSIIKNQHTPMLFGLTQFYLFPK